MKKSNYTILLCEDEIKVLNILCEIFLSEGYQVLQSMDGKQAIEILQNEKVDLLLTGVKMPRPDGYTLIHVVRIILPNLPILVLSGHITKIDMDELLDIGADVCMKKPPDLHQLLEVVESLL